MHTDQNAHRYIFYNYCLLWVDHRNTSINYLHICTIMENPNNSVFFPQ